MQYIYNLKYVYVQVISGERAERYIPKGFGWRETTFRKYKTVAEHDDHEQPNTNNSTHFHSRAQGQTLQPFPTLTLIYTYHKTPLTGIRVRVKYIILIYVYI